MFMQKKESHTGLEWPEGSGGLAIWSTGSFPGGPLYNVGQSFP